MRLARIRCHKECERKLSTACQPVLLISGIQVTQVPPMTPVLQSSMSVQHSEYGGGFNPSYSHMPTSSSSGASSALPSPLPTGPNMSRNLFPKQYLADSFNAKSNGSGASIDESPATSTSWQSVGKLMNRLVNTITTPKQAQKPSRGHLNPGFYFFILFHELHISYFIISASSSQNQNQAHRATAQNPIHQACQKRIKNISLNRPPTFRFIRPAQPATPLTLTTNSIR